MYFVRTPATARLIYPSLVWNIKEKDKVIYLTFDDGPDESVTPSTLEILNRYNAKATFFCVGEKVKQNKTIFQNVIEMGHSVGNHTFNHLKGTQTSISDYIENIEKANKLIQSNLFRPPYGKINGNQVRRIRNKYKIIMWSVLPGDFDYKVNKQSVLKRLIKHTTNGSIVVLHDNNKFKDKMMYALEGFLDHFSTMGYEFNAITPDIL